MGGAALLQVVLPRLPEPRSRRWRELAESGLQGVGDSEKSQFQKYTAGA